MVDITRCIHGMVADYTMIKAQMPVKTTETHIWHSHRLNHGTNRKSQNNIENLITTTYGTVSLTKPLHQKLEAQ